MNRHASKRMGRSAPRYPTQAADLDARSFRFGLAEGPRPSVSASVNAKVSSQDHMKVVCNVHALTVPECIRTLCERRWNRKCSTWSLSHDCTLIHTASSLQAHRMMLHYKTSLRRAQGGTSRAALQHAIQLSSGFLPSPPTTRRLRRPAATVGGPSL